MLDLCIFLSWIRQEDPLVSKWCKDKFIQIWWRNKLSNFLVGVNFLQTFFFHFGWTIPLFCRFRWICRFIQALFRSNLFTQPNKDPTEIHSIIEPNIQIILGQSQLRTGNHKRTFAYGFTDQPLHWFTCVYLRQELFAELIKVILNHLASIHKQVYPSLSCPLSWSVLMSRTPALAADLTVQMDASHSSLFSCICLQCLPLSLSLSLSLSLWWGFKLSCLCSLIRCLFLAQNQCCLEVSMLKIEKASSHASFSLSFQTEAVEDNWLKDRKISM